MASVDTRRVGMAVVRLGGGRSKPGEAVDPTVGFTEVAGLGEEVGRERPLALVHARSEEDAREAEKALQEAFVVSAEPCVPGPVVRGRLGGVVA